METCHFQMDAETTAHFLLHCNIYTTERMKMLKNQAGCREASQREKVNTDNMQFGFMPGHGTTDAIYDNCKKSTWAKRKIYTLHLLTWRCSVLGNGQVRC